MHTYEYSTGPLAPLGLSLGLLLGLRFCKQLCVHTCSSSLFSFSFKTTTGSSADKGVGPDGLGACCCTKATGISEAITEMEEAGFEELLCRIRIEESSFDFFDKARAAKVAEVKHDSQFSAEAELDENSLVVRWLPSDKTAWDAHEALKKKTEFVEPKVFELSSNIISRFAAIASSFRLDFLFFVLLFKPRLVIR